MCFSLIFALFGHIYRLLSQRTFMLELRFYLKMCELSCVHIVSLQELYR